MTFMKASILVFYLKLFPGKLVKVGSYTLLFIVVSVICSHYPNPWLNFIASGYGIASTFVLIFQCFPLGGNEFTPGIVLKVSHTDYRSVLY
jgi:hypothetical protein